MDYRRARRIPVAKYHPLGVADQIKGGASNELFKEYRDSAAHASRHRRSYSRVLLCGAAGARTYEFRRLRPELAFALNSDRRDVQHAFSIPPLS
jgi:hypothetical protein